jgi:MtN3 and saliva related transmembrane protein
MNPDIIGWTAAAILLATLIRQVYTQYRERSARGVSKWLFIGQMAASVGFVIYSWQVRNWVFVTVNALILCTAIAGELIFLANKRRAATGQAKTR